MYYRYQEQTYGWGSSSYPREAAKQMHLAEHLQSVPKHGLVVDVGAGINLSLGAFIGVTRPDVGIVSVDPGYSGRFSERFSVGSLDETIRTFEPCQQLWLQNCSLWRKQMVASEAEQLPLADNVADLVVSYAVAPEHTWDTTAVLRESLRILKIGSVAVFGPVADYMEDTWDRSLADAGVAELLDDRVDTRAVISPWGEERHVLFSALKRA